MTRAIAARLAIDADILDRHVDRAVVYDSVARVRPEIEFALEEQ